MQALRVKGVQPWPRWVCTNLLPDARSRAVPAFGQPWQHGQRTSAELGVLGPGRRGDGGGSFSTFVRPGDQPEVLRFLLEFLFADLLGLDQVKYPCRGKHGASDSEDQLGSMMRCSSHPPERHNQGTEAPGMQQGPATETSWEFGMSSPGLAAISFPNSDYSPNRNTALRHHGAGGTNKTLLLWKISRPGEALISPKPPGKLRWDQQDPSSLPLCSLSPSPLPMGAPQSPLHPRALPYPRSSPHQVFSIPLPPALKFLQDRKSGLTSAQTDGSARASTVPLGGGCA